MKFVKKCKISTKMRWQWCWWLNKGDRFKIFVAKSLCWWLYQSPKLQISRQLSNLSPRQTVTNICHQHRCYPWLWWRKIDIEGCYLAQCQPLISLWGAKGKLVDKGFYSRVVFCQKVIRVLANRFIEIGNIGRHD